MNNPIKEQYPQHNFKSPGDRAEFLTNYQRLRFPIPMSTQKTNNSPLSRIPTGEEPQPNRPIYTQITGRQQEDQSLRNKDYSSNIREVQRSRNNGSSHGSPFVLQGRSSYSFGS